MLIGSGSTPNYTALLLFVAGMAAYYSQVGGRWGVPTAVALLLMLAACLLVAASRKEE